VVVARGERVAERVVRGERTEEGSDQARRGDAAARVAALNRCVAGNAREAACVAGAHGDRAPGVGIANDEGVGEADEAAAIAVGRRDRAAGGAALQGDRATTLGLTEETTDREGARGAPRCRTVLNDEARVGRADEPSDVRGGADVPGRGAVDDDSCLRIPDEAACAFATARKEHVPGGERSFDSRTRQDGSSQATDEAKVRTDRPVRLTVG